MAAPMGEGYESMSRDELIRDLRNKQAVINYLNERMDSKMVKNIIRNGGDGRLDEVFCEPCQFHLEQMDDGHWWIGVLLPGGTFHHINLVSKGYIKANIETETHEGDTVAGIASQ